MSKLNDLTAITTPDLTDLVYCVQNSTDYKVTNAQLLELIKTNSIISLTQAQYDALPSAEKNNGSIYIITDASITADDVEYSSGVSVGDKLDELSTVTTGTCPIDQTNVTSGSINYVKIGRLVTVSGYILHANGTAIQTVFTLAYPPMISSDIPAQHDDSPYCTYLSVTANQTTVKVGPHSANKYTRFNFAYISAT